MGPKVIAATVVIVAVIAAGVGAFILLQDEGEKPGAALPKALTTADGRTILWAAAQETGAKSAANTQFYVDHPDTPPDATLNMQATPDENEEYWVVTVSYENESENYWVPQEKPKELRMQVGQSLSYIISGSYQVAGITGSISGSMSFSVPETVTYQGVQCLKVTLSYNVTIMEMTTSVSGYMYADEDYRPRYSNMTMEMMGQTITMIVDYNYTTGKMTMTYDETSMVEDIPDDVFNQQYLNTFVGEDLYVGWSKELSYGTGTAAYTMTFTVVDEVLVTVPAGTFRCYKVTASMPEMEGVQISINTYTNAQMTLVPKMTMDMQTTTLEQTSSVSMTMELESYSGF